MRIRRTLGTAALAAAATLAAGTVAPAQAAGATAPAAGTVAVLTHTAPGTLGGPNVSVGDVLAADLVSGTTANFYSSATGTTGIKCATSAFSATVITNPAAPGTATESLNTQTFGSCTANVIGVTGVQSITVNNLAYVNSVSDAAGFPVSLDPGTAGPVQTTVVLKTILGTITCVYRSPGGLAGTTNNTGQTIGFTAQALPKSSGPSTCFPVGYFSATYGPVRDVSVAGNPVVYVN
ncbi:Tat pathway signal sequence domain protein [Kitasatospora sp. NPDC057692]|uniref:Tat pathway signal sequence domain protein n=1 Tax=Kitasatospora sp. NPDC057692 TaxID=3346215 RepID=UPI00368998C8